MKKVTLIAAFFCLNFLAVNLYAQDGEDKVKQAFDLFETSYQAFTSDNLDEAIKQGNSAYDLVRDKPEGSEPLIENIGKSLPRYHYSKAASLLKEQKYTEAILSLDLAKKSATEFNNTDALSQVTSLVPQVYLAQAGTDMGAKKYDDAIMHAQAAADNGSTTSQVYYIQALAYLQKADNAKAEELFLKTIEIAKANQEESQLNGSNGQLSVIYLKNAIAAQTAKKWGDMLSNAEKSLEFKESTNGYKLKGVAAAQLKKWDDVIAAWSPLLDDAKEKGAANYNIALAYQGKNNTAKACEHFKKVGADARYKVPAEQQIKNAKCS